MRKAAAEMGRKGGLAAAAGMTPAEKKARARKAGKASGRVRTAKARAKAKQKKV